MIRKALFATTAAVALFGFAAAPASAQYGPEGATLTVESEQVPQCGTLNVAGDGFDPDTTYEIGSIYYGPTDEAGEPDNTRALPEAEGNDDLGTVTTDAEGSFTEAIDIAADAPLGLYVLGIDNEIVEIPDEGGYSNIDTVEFEVVAGTCDETPAPNNGGAGNNVGNNAGGGGTLARTGSTTLPLVGAGLGLLATGGALLFLNKRRSIV